MANESFSDAELRNADGVFSTRNLLVALIVTSLGGTGVSFVRTDEAYLDRWRQTDQEKWEVQFRREYDAKIDRVGERNQSRIDSLSHRTETIESALTNHQDGHPARVEATVDRLSVQVERLQGRIREIERALDRGKADG